MRPEYILKTDLYEYLAAVKDGLDKKARLRSARGASALCEEIIAHFGLSAGAKTTIVRDE